MKKIKNFPSYLKLQNRRKKRFLNRDLEKYQIKAFNKIDVLKELGYVYQTAPLDFSLVNNPTEMIYFLNRLKKILLAGRSVLLDFSNAIDITNEGFIALLSIIQDDRVPPNVHVRAKKPKSLKLRQRMKENGILQESTGLETVISPKFGRFRQKSSLSADMEEANELIKFATKEIFGKRDKLTDVQRIFGECIDNTTYHAQPGKRLAEKWWGTVFCDTKEKIAYFSVMDNGVGIIESLKVNWKQMLSFFYKYKDNAEIMRAIFQGAVLSSTGLSNRGNGLPNIYKARSRKQFTRLIVISNNVYVDFDNDDYRLLEESFSGTLFYWEVRNENDDPRSNASN